MSSPTTGTSEIFELSIAGIAIIPASSCGASANGQSQGRKKKGQYEYSLTWDQVIYAPGELKAVAYKNGKLWAESTVKTTGAAKAIQLPADRSTIHGDGMDLNFVTTQIVDADGLVVPTAITRVKYEISSGPGEIVATANGDQTDLESFPNPQRNAFNGLALVLIRSKPGQTGDIHLKASGEGVSGSEITVKAK